jgi:hypothetical protein
MKRARFPIFAFMAILSIAACKKSDPVADEANAIPPAESTTDNAGPAAGGPPPISPNADAAAVIPAQLQGRWGLTPADCTSTRGDNKGLLVVTGDALKFYESRAMPGISIEKTDHSISGEFNFTGEGQSWTKYESLKLQSDGLVRTERNPAASYTYAKC